MTAPHLLLHVLGWLGVMALVFVLGDTLSGHATPADAIMATCGVGLAATALLVPKA
jgi:hypothetical protein